MLMLLLLAEFVLVVFLIACLVLFQLLSALNVKQLTLYFPITLPTLFVFKIVQINITKLIALVSHVYLLVSFVQQHIHALLVLTYSSLRVVHVILAKILV